jgi:hypothetical protein
MEDREFAREVLEGRAGNDQVREALLADLDENTEVSGFAVSDYLSPSGSESQLGKPLTWNIGMSFPNLEACCKGTHYESGGGAGKV